MKSFLPAILAFLAPIGASLKILFAPEEWNKAFAAAVGTSTLAGFAASVLTTIGTDAGADTSAGITAAVVSYVLLTIAGKLKAAQAGAAQADGLANLAHDRLDAQANAGRPFVA